MKSLALIGIVISAQLVSCAPRIARKDFHIVTETRSYRIGQKQDTNYFLIHAMSIDEALAAADKELDCSKRVCVIAPAGIILSVERPNEQPSKNSNK